MTVKQKIKIDIYGCFINVTICTDIRRSINYYCKKYNKNDKGIDYDVAALFFTPGESIINYYLFFDFAYLTMNSINHETSHVAEEILVNRGIRASGEQRAYLEGYISDKIYYFIKRKKLKILFEK